MSAKSSCAENCVKGSTYISLLYGSFNLEMWNEKRAKKIREIEGENEREVKKIREKEENKRDRETEREVSDIMKKQREIRIRREND